jgi:hypothetical protein
VIIVGTPVERSRPRILPELPLGIRELLLVYGRVDIILRRRHRPPPPWHQEPPQGHGQESHRDPDSHGALSGWMTLK